MLLGTDKDEKYREQPVSFVMADVGIEENGPAEPNRKSSTKGKMKRLDTIDEHNQQLEVENNNDVDGKQDI